MAKIGNPEIPTPGALTLAVLQQAVNNIRERFKALEAAVTANAATATASNRTTATDLARQLQLLRVDVDAITATLAAIDTGEDAPDHAAAIARLGRLARESENHSPPPLSRATIRAAAAEVEQFAPEAPWRVPLMRLTERVEALEQGSSA